MSELGHNQPILSVSDFSRSLKGMVEENFAHIKIKGEISGFKITAGSGHAYFALKDENALLSAVCWRGTLSRLNLRPEDGIEVIATGKITTFSGRSQYQIVVESMEIAGEGALLKLLEERRKKLAAEGLFDASRKREIPFLPKVIGVITSPSGAVIRDIMHRINERFPIPVLLWGTPVQGDGAAEKIAAAINGFNSLKEGGKVPRPDVIIVARGGGSIEDLWAFNEEIVVRAAANSKIPIISAVGHETDTTLIDYAADLRAPTPTGAAEKATPVRLDLAAQIGTLENRIIRATSRLLEQHKNRITDLARALPKPEQIVFEKIQLLDDRNHRLNSGIKVFLTNKSHQTTNLALKIKRPEEQMAKAQHKLKETATKLFHLTDKATTHASQRLAQTTTKLSAKQIKREIDNLAERQKNIAQSLNKNIMRQIKELTTNLSHLNERLYNCSFERTLERGFAIVKNSTNNQIISNKIVAEQNDSLCIQFYDGETRAKVDKGNNQKNKEKTPPNQGELF